MDVVRLPQASLVVTRWHWLKGASASAEDGWMTGSSGGGRAGGEAGAHAGCAFLQTATYSV
jgi:hypothetical protein